MLRKPKGYKFLVAYYSRCFPDFGRNAYSLEAISAKAMGEMSARGMAL